MIHNAEKIPLAALSITVTGSFIRLFPLCQIDQKQEACLVFVRLF